MENVFKYFEAFCFTPWELDACRELEADVEAAEADQENDALLIF
jgi:hypothetical protein